MLFEIRLACFRLGSKDQKNGSKQTFSVQVILTPGLLVSKDPPGLFCFQEPLQGGLRRRGTQPSQTVRVVLWKYKQVLFRLSLGCKKHVEETAKP